MGIVLTLLASYLCRVMAVTEVILIQKPATKHKIQILVGMDVVWAFQMPLWGGDGPRSV